MVLWLCGEKGQADGKEAHSSGSEGHGDMPRSGRRGVETMGLVIRWVACWEGVGRGQGGVRAVSGQVWGLAGEGHDG